MSWRSRPVGWRSDSYRHYLAAKGVRTSYRNVMRPVDVRKSPQGSNWRVERKFDGTRILAGVDARQVILVNRRGADKTRTFPELAELKSEVKGSAVLDGEVVVFRNGRDDFKALAERDHLKDAQKVADGEREQPVTYVVFDVLEHNGVDVRSLPLAEREKLLAELVDVKGRVVRAGETTVAVARKQHAEGVIFKDKGSPYVGGPSKYWRKFKFKKEADVMVTGFEPGKGKREGRIGALRIGVHGARGVVPVGKVGTGFTDADLARLMPKVRSGKPFVVRVQYLKRGSRGALREPSFIAERTDIRPEQTHV